MQKDALIKKNDAKPAAPTCLAENKECSMYSIKCCDGFECKESWATLRGKFQQYYGCFAKSKVGEIVDEMKLTPLDCLYVIMIKHL